MESAGAPVFPPERTRVSGRRFAAHVLDGSVYAVLFVLLVLIAGRTTDFILAATFVGGFTFLHVAYFVVLQRRHGRTPGKALVGIRVVDAAGEVPTTGALVKRSIPLLVEYLYVIALIGMLTSEYRQRFGDRWGGTYVVAD
jgi:uncharacterized RDD family membrane protein YckC